MIQHRWTVICHDSSVDRDSNNITLYRAFAYVRVARPRPQDHATFRGVLAQVRCHVVTCWGRPTKDKGDTGKARMVLVGPDGDELASEEYDVDLAHGTQHHQRTAIVQIPVTRDGRYGFRIDRMAASGEWEPVAQAPLDIEIDWLDGPGK